MEGIDRAGSRALTTVALKFFLLLLLFFFCVKFFTCELPVDV